MSVSLLTLGVSQAGAAPGVAAAPRAHAAVTALGSSRAPVTSQGALVRAGQVASPFANPSAPRVATPLRGARQMPLLKRPVLHTAKPFSASVPIISCAPMGPGCDSVSAGNGGAMTNRNGLRATANSQLYGLDVEPPDQGVCAGNSYVMEDINIGELQVFSSALHPVSPIISLDSLMGLAARGWSSGGDISCMYDPDNGGHWFVTEFVSTTSEAGGGTFTGCFAGVFDTCREGVAVSSSANPLTSTWNIYFLDPNLVSPNDPGAGYLLNDFAKIGNTRDAFLLFYDEFNLNSGTIPPCPAYGCNGFNGSQELAIQKSALESGAARVNFVHVNMGTDPAIQPPDGSCYTGPTAGVTCWYQDIPAASPTDSDFDNASGGTGFVVGSLDFTGTGDSRVAVFYWTHLSALNSPGCSSCSMVGFGGKLFTGVEPYMDEGAACPAAAGGPCGLAPQKKGIVDLGTYCASMGLAQNQPCPEGGIATNGDGTTQASFEGGHLWFAVSTLVTETFHVIHETHVGAAYWVVTPGAPLHGAPTLTLTNQGYVAAAHEDVEFPTTIGGNGAGLMSFTLSGNGGPTGAHGGGYFPSSAYGLLTTGVSGLTNSTVYVSAAGLAPQDGFTEYQGLPGPIRPRWGDYGAGVYDPGLGFVFSSEYIPSNACQPYVWYHVDMTCGGTRDPLANFGTSVNVLP